MFIACFGCWRNYCLVAMIIIFFTTKLQQVTMVLRITFRFKWLNLFLVSKEKATALGLKLQHHNNYWAISMLKCMYYVQYRFYTYIVLSQITMATKRCGKILGYSHIFHTRLVIIIIQNSGVYCATLMVSWQKVIAEGPCTESVYTLPQRAKHFKVQHKLIMAIANNSEVIRKKRKKYCDIWDY